jgi:hypothetical protein
MCRAIAKYRLILLGRKTIEIVFTFFSKLLFNRPTAGQDDEDMTVLDGPFELRQI